MRKIIFNWIALTTAGPTILPNKTQSVPLVDGRIVGGVETTIEQFPHQVVVRFNENFICGGSILTHTKILTAAHCTGGSNNPTGFSIRAGSTLYASDGVTRLVIQIDVHEGYASNQDYDIAIMTLESELEFGSKIWSINLPLQGETLSPGTRVNVTGWGTTSSGGSVSQTLRVVNVAIVNHNVCRVAYAFFGSVGDYEICAGGLGHDSCQGDSGEKTLN